MKKFLCLVLLVTIIASVVLINPCYAELKSFVNNEKAIDLKLLGLFSGSDKDFELGRAPTRGEGLLMFTKLLSVEKEAKLLGLSHPFKDVPSSAKAQIGYLFNKGFLNSTNSSMLGYDKPLSAQEYIEYILKALGYYDSSAQLQTSDSLEKAVLINLLSRNEADSLKNKTFLRDDLILLSYNALLAKLKDSNTTLLDKLITSDKVVSETIAATLRLYTTDVQNELLGITEFNPATTSLGSVINTSTDLFKILRKNLYLNETDFNIDFSSYSGNLFSDFEATITRAILAVTKATGVENFISSWDYSSTGNVLNIKIKYRYTKNVFLEKKQQNTDVINKARHTLNGIIKSGMSIYNKELAIHDYIVKNSAYDYTNYIKTHCQTQHTKLMVALF